MVLGCRSHVGSLGLKYYQRLWSPFPARLPSGFGCCYGFYHSPRPFPLISFPFPLGSTPRFSCHSCVLASFPLFFFFACYLLRICAKWSAPTLPFYRSNLHSLQQLLCFTSTRLSHCRAHFFFTLAHRPLCCPANCYTGYAVWLFNSLALTNCIALIAQVTLEMCQKRT